MFFHLCDFGMKYDFKMAAWRRFVLSECFTAIIFYTAQ